MNDFDTLEEYSRRKTKITAYENYLQNTSLVNSFPAPVVWRRFCIYFKIEDFHVKYLPWALNLIKEDYVHKDLICSNCNIASSSRALNKFAKLMTVLLLEGFSVVAVNEKTNEPVAFQIFTVQKKNELQKSFLNTRVEENELIKYMEINIYLNSQIDYHLKFKTDSVFIFGPTVVEPQYREKGMGAHFFDVGIEVAKAYNVSVICGIFDCYGNQKRAEDIGLKVVFERTIDDWHHKNGEKVITKNPINLESIKVMAGRIQEEKPVVNSQ